MTDPDNSPNQPPEVALPNTPGEILLGLSGVAVSTTIVAFDATIISTILPEVAKALDGMSLYSWAATAYFLAVSVTILVFGRLSDVFGRKWLMLLALLTVSIGSTLGGLAMNMPELIGARIVQGVGGGMLIGSAFAAPADLFSDPKRRVKWLVLLSGTYAIASGSGPMLGGALTEAFGWRAAFFVIPVTALVAAPLIWLFFPAIRKPVRAPFKMDWLGTALLIYMIGAPLIAIEQLSKIQSTLPDWVCILMLLLSVLAGRVLYKIEGKQQTPIFPFRVLQTRQARLLNVSSIISGSVMFSLIYYVPLLLQSAFKLSPTMAGVLIAPLVAGVPVGSIINGRIFPLAQKPQYIMLSGALLLSLGCGLALTFNAASPMWSIMSTMAICGIGLGLLLSNYTLFMQIVVHPDDIGLGSALIQTTRALGSAIGTSFVGLAIAHSSVHAGMKSSLLAGVFLCLITAYLTWEIDLPEKDKNP